MEYNDYEVVSLAQEGNEDATSLLYQKYKPIIIKKSKNAIMYAPHHGIEISDIMQEAYIGLDEAIKNFSQDDSATFYTFAMVCIERKIFNYLKKVTRSKNKILNEAVYIDENIEGLIKDSLDIEYNFLGNDNENKLMDLIQEKLTDFELEVFKMKVKGYSFEEIAKDLNKDIKSIYNTFQRIKVKIKKYVKLDDYL